MRISLKNILAKAVKSGNIDWTMKAAASVTVTKNGGTYTLPAGLHYVSLATTTKAQVYIDATETWVDVISEAGKGLLWSDGANVRLYNGNTTNDETSKIRTLA